MLLQKYYHALLGFSIFAVVPLCGASRNIRIGLRKLKERAAPEPTFSDKQHVLPELERRQTPISSYPDVGPVTDVTIETEIVVIPPSSLPPVTVTSISISTAPPLPLPTTTSTISSTSSSSQSISSQASITTTPPDAQCSNGYYLCADEYNGGCCRSGFSCAISSCVPPATATGIGLTCSLGSYLCPASLNYGCCPNSFDCGVTACLSQITATTTATYTSIALSTTYTVLTTAVPPYVTVGKATASDLYAKLPTVSSSSSPFPTESPLGSGVPLSGIAIGGIVAGSVIGVSVFLLAGWCTYRRLKKRGNNDAPGGVPTTNFFDPNATTTSRSHGNGSYQPVMQEQGYFVKQPATPILNASPQASPPIEGVAEMPVNSVSYSESANWWSTDQVQPGGQNVYEVEGTPTGKRTNRWSKPFMKR